jgi:5'-nucleotidase
MKLHGESVEMARTYRITVNNFMASGGDTFTVLKQGNRVQEGEVDLVVAKLFMRVKGLINPPVLDRIQRIN